MRRLLSSLVLLGLLGSLRAADVEFVRVWPQWRTAISFMRISEYFTNQENTSGRIILRTHPAKRAGYYFLARVNHPKVGLAGAKFILHVITPENPEPKVFTFPADAPAGMNVFELGLTGSDWTSAKVHPVAWRLELSAADGRTLAAQQSFLWSKPDQ